jgi:hypothetical protein
MSRNSENQRQEAGQKQPQQQAPSTEGKNKDWAKVKTEIKRRRNKASHKSVQNRGSDQQPTKEVNQMREHEYEKPDIERREVEPEMKDRSDQNAQQKSNKEKNADFDKGKKPTQHT